MIENEYEVVKKMRTYLVVVTHNYRNPWGQLLRREYSNDKNFDTLPEAEERIQELRRRDDARRI